MRQRYPGVPVVTYVNTSAAVKAESDICCTSGKRSRSSSRLAPRVIMLPDEYLAQNIAAQTKVKIIAWNGHCEVHELFTPADVGKLREKHPGVAVLAHPECPPEVVAEADFAGSTAAMSDYVGKRAAARGADDGMLDERQRRGRASRGRIHPALQSVPAHEADHAGEHPLGPRDRPASGHDRSQHRRTGAAGGGADAGDMGAEIQISPAGRSSSAEVSRD